MVNGLNVTGADNSPVLSYRDFKNASFQLVDDESIFSENSSTGIDELNEQLNSVEADNGIVTKGWNAIKEFTGLGTSAEKCEDAIEQYKKGEITFEEASEQINDYKDKQNSSLELFSNIATSVAAIGTVAAVTIVTGGLGLPAAIAIGAGAGAAVKTGFKLADRATNEVEGDELNANQMVKDALSGAVTGGLATATMGTAGGASGVKDAALQCGKTGLKTGAISGASNYTINTAFDEDKDFNAGDFASSTLQGAVIGGSVGTVMGGINGTLRDSGVLNSGCSLKDMVVSSDSVNVGDVVANSACTTSYKIMNDGIRKIAA